MIIDEIRKELESDLFQVFINKMDPGVLFKKACHLFAAYETCFGDDEKKYFHNFLHSLGEWLEFNGLFEEGECQSTYIHCVHNSIGKEWERYLKSKDIELIIQEEEAE